MLCTRWVLSSLLVNILQLSAARLTNRTIDDELGDAITGSLPEYYPPNIWSQGISCPQCKAKLDVSKCFDGTWHDTTQYPSDTIHSVTVRFNGTAVYVYNALAGTDLADEPRGAALTKLTFTLDGAVSIANFTHTAKNNSSPEYNVLVYSNSTLEDKPHVLIMSAVKDTSQSSLILFDYVVYTVVEDEQPQAPSSPSSTTGWQKSSSLVRIVGGVIGGLLSLVVIVALWFLVLRKRGWNAQTRICCITWASPRTTLQSSGYVEGASVIPPSQDGARIGAARLPVHTGRDPHPPPTFDEAIRGAPQGAKAFGNMRQARDVVPRTRIESLVSSSMDGSGYLYDRSGVPRSAIPVEMRMAALRKELERLR